MSKPETPTPPNPLSTAAAATGTNVSTAIANANLNNMNQVTPTGSLDYNQTGSYSWTDPTTGASYNVPRFTATQTLSPQEQAIQNQTLGTQYNLAGMANAQSAADAARLSQPFDPTGNAPSGGNAQNILNIPGAQTSFASGGPIQSQIDTSGLANTSNIQSSYGAGGNYSADRQAVQDALMARMNPQLDIQQNKLQQQLADQGIRYGSDAYNNAMVPLNQQRNDAMMAAIQGGGQEQMNLNQMAAQQAAFGNAAQAQAFGQNTAAGSFANQAQGQQFGQNAAQATFRNAGLAQDVAQQQAGFNASQAQRNQAMQEAYAQRNQPINEITALMSGSQVSQPNWLNTPSSQIPTTDVAGLINNNFAQQMGIYQQQNQNYQSLMGGILGLGGNIATAGVLKSDERIKDVDDKIATVFAADDGGERHELPIYRYSYKADPAKAMHIGPMAQDVEKIVPKAVVENARGIKMIHPGMVMGSILKAA